MIEMFWYSEIKHEIRARETGEWKQHFLKYRKGKLLFDLLVPQFLVIQHSKQELYEDIGLQAYNRAWGSGTLCT